MRVYETAFIINPQSDDATIDRQVKAVADIITNNGGKMLHEDRLGTRRMAYEIQGLTQGYYTSFIFESESSVPSLLNRHYRLEEPYIRHLTILFEGDLETVKSGGPELAGPGRYRPDSRRTGRPSEQSSSSGDEPTVKTTSDRVESTPAAENTEEKTEKTIEEAGKDESAQPSESVGVVESTPMEETKVTSEPSETESSSTDTPTRNQQDETEDEEL